MHTHKTYSVRTNCYHTGIVLIFLLAFSGSCNAARSEEIIYLEADTVDIDDKKGTSIYRGNVKLSRGEMTVRADIITVYKNKTGLEKLIATGAPVVFTRAASIQQNNIEQKEIKGQALEIEYSAKNEIIKFKDSARLWQGKDQFSGNLIVYDIAKEIVSASKGSNKTGRVKVIIHPEADSTENNN